MILLYTDCILYDAQKRTRFAGEIGVDRESGVIVSVSEPGQTERAGKTVVSLHGLSVLPGLVDVHTHGRAGGDFVSADEALLAKMAKSYARAGVTAVMPTFASAPLDDFASAADRVFRASGTPDGAHFYGLHLEGRYLNPAKRGAHAPALLAPLCAQELRTLSMRMRRAWNETGVDCPLRVSAALELDTDGSFAAVAKEEGISLSLGHTEADFATAMQAAENGTAGFTHLFNAMPPLHHRAGGAVAACFESAARGLPVFGEIICDGFHISREMVRLAYRLLGNAHTVLISDSMEGTGCPDGDYTIAGMHVTLRGGKALTDDGHIAGSTLGLFDGLCNLMEFCSLSLAEALPCATVNPAKLAGLEDRCGLIAVGRPADLLFVDESVPRPRLVGVTVGKLPLFQLEVSV